VEENPSWPGGLATYVGCLYATISCFPKFPLDDGGKHSEKRKPGGKGKTKKRIKAAAAVAESYSSDKFEGNVSDDCPSHPDGRQGVVVIHPLHPFQPG